MFPTLSDHRKSRNRPSSPACPPPSPNRPRNFRFSENSKIGKSRKPSTVLRSPSTDGRSGTVRPAPSTTALLRPFGAPRDCSGRWEHCESDECGRPRHRQRSAQRNRAVPTPDSGPSDSLSLCLSASLVHFVLRQRAPAALAAPCRSSAACGRPGICLSERLRGLVGENDLARLPLWRNSPKAAESGRKGIRRCLTSVGIQSLPPAVP